MRRLVLTLSFCVMLGAGSAAGAAPARPVDRRPVVARPDALNRALAFVEDARDIQSYVRARQMGDVVAYVEARAQADLDAYLAALYVPPPPAPVSVPGSSASPHGGHSDLWWSGVAQCEQGGRNDPYFGFFSFMDGSQGGRPWAEQVAAGNALLSRYAERESQGGAWADSCIDAGYAASPGG